MNTSSPCPCGSSLPYENCCGQLHSGTEVAPTAEALMRSRYSAFVKHEASYLMETTWPARRKHVKEEEYLVRARESIWLGLSIQETEAGSDTDTKGTVTFTAKSMVNGMVHEQTEKSLFKKKDGRWFYVKPVESDRGPHLMFD